MSICSRGIFLDVCEMQLYEWLFHRLIGILNTGKWTIAVRDFSRSRNVKERTSIGYVDEEQMVIHIDENYATPGLLIHELLHILFDEILYEELEYASKKELASVKGKTLVNKKENWVESRIQACEDLCCATFSSAQLELFQWYLDKAKAQRRKKSSIRRKK